MPASPADSAIYRELMGDAEVARLLSDTAEVRAMLLVEGALARAQGALGLIPETAARAIHRASMELQIDPGGLAAGAGQSGVPVPALVNAFRSAMQAPDHAQFLHWGATSQDIVDTGLALRLRQILLILEARLRDLARTLGDLAERHAETPMPGRTYGQLATPTAFGAVVAGWGAPHLRHLERLAELRPRVLRVSLAGAAGTLSAMGEDGPRVRAALAEALDLADPGASWHAERDGPAELAAWLTLVTGSLGKMGADLVLLTQSEVAEVRLGAAGGSSTMPQKANPVLPSLLVALARQVATLDGAMQEAMVHTHQRDGAAWFIEWMSLPQMCLLTGRATAAALEVAQGLEADEAAMAHHLEKGGGAIHAEALSFVLARQMPRQEAQGAVKALCAQTARSGRHLLDLAREAYPDSDLDVVRQPARALGTAPAEARRFAAAARALPSG
ncbi:class-II fumarase/aspartase family protein [Roseitranquillus sediminis]|uniref:class-II fumarase/aspartase family protein n=1 Tax=Roseitranquillus sediminis TaxID=2809051 RepID=UPI001D0CBE29|nr:adenylosuccinate lyase family protein [Roseitranquillus sediminis]MBM9593091.1 adenylosuccinate lyase family protein [Roseitranquillus sediminis]